MVFYLKPMLSDKALVKHLTFDHYCFEMSHRGVDKIFLQN